MTGEVKVWFWSRGREGSLRKGSRGRTSVESGGREQEVEVPEILTVVEQRPWVKGNVSGRCQETPI